MIEVTVQGKDLKECISKLGDAFLSMIPTETLVEEIRTRMKRQGLEVSFDAVTVTTPVTEKDDPETEEVVATPQVVAIPQTSIEVPKRRGRPPKYAYVDPPEMVTQEKVQPVVSKNAESDQESILKTNGTIPEGKIIEALNAYASTHGGPAAARSIMKTVCGATKLGDCKKDDYARLLEALGGN